MRVLPLPMGEVPLKGAERANFTLSVGFAASSPKVGAKEKRGERIVPGENSRTNTQKGLPSARQAFFLQFSKASYFHRPSGYLPASVMAFRALTTMGLSAA